MKILVDPDKEMELMNKQIVQTDNAPAAVGPYSQAVRIGDMVYTAGQIALNPETMEIVTDSETPTAVQAEQVLKNLTAVLEAAGSSIDNVIKTTVFLRYMKDFAEMNGVYARYFGDFPPARSTVAVAALPLGVRVEIEAIAFVETAVEQIAMPLEKPKKKKKKSKKKDEKKKKGKKEKVAA